MLKNNVESPQELLDPMSKTSSPKIFSDADLFDEPHHFRMTGHLTSTLDRFMAREEVKGGQYIASNVHVVFKPA